MMICNAGKRISHLLLLLIVIIIHAVSSTAFSKQPATTSLRMSTAANPTPTSSSDLHVTILGGGNVGSTLAQKLAQSNKFGSVKIAARDPTKTTSSIRAKGVTDGVSVVAATPEALSTSNVVILATPGLYEDDDINSFVSSLGDMTDKVILDATNPLGPYTEGLQVKTWEGGISSGEKLQQYLPNAKVYKTFNTVGVEHMREALGKEMLIAGDADPSYRAIAESLSMSDPSAIREISRPWQNCGFTWQSLVSEEEILVGTFGSQSVGTRDERDKSRSLNNFDERDKYGAYI
ncbi:hypothetical protein ACHAWC_001173 [Mediolabrus comicus]